MWSKRRRKTMERCLACHGTFHHCLICSLFCQTTSQLAFRQRKQKKPFDSLLKIQKSHSLFPIKKLLMMPNVIYTQQYGSLNIFISLIKGKKSQVKRLRANVSLSLTLLAGKKTKRTVWMSYISESKRKTSGSTLALTTSGSKINSRGRGKFITVSALITLYLGFNTSSQTIKDTHTRKNTRCLRVYA